MSLQILHGGSLFFASLCSYFDLMSQTLPCWLYRGSRGKAAPLSPLLSGSPSGKRNPSLGWWEGRIWHPSLLTGVNRIKLSRVLHFRSPVLRIGSAHGLLLLPSHPLFSLGKLPQPALLPKGNLQLSSCAVGAWPICLVQRGRSRNPRYLCILTLP